MTTFKKLCVLVILMLPAIATGGVLNLFSGFRIEREVILDPENNSGPSELLKAADGGYFVLETGYGNGVIKTDSQGQRQWIYRDPIHAGTVVGFTGAAATLDGGVLLCGNRGESGKNDSDALGGVVILLDKMGHEVNRIDPTLRGYDNNDLLTEASGCSNWGDGFFVFGEAQVTGSYLGGAKTTYKITTQMKLDRKGKIVWKVKRLASEIKTIDGIARPLSNGNLVLKSFDDLSLLDPNGNVIKRAKLDGPCVWVNRQDSIEHLQFLCRANEAIITTPHMAQLDEKLNQISDTKYLTLKSSPGSIGLASVVAMPNGSIVIFGATTGLIYPFVPLIIGLNADQSVVARYEIYGNHEDGFIAGLPTAVSGEYVTVRPVLLRGKGCTAMTFFRRN